MTQNDCSIRQANFEFGSVIGVLMPSNSSDAGLNSIYNNFMYPSQILGDGFKGLQLAFRQRGSEVRYCGQEPSQLSQDLRLIK